MTASAARVDRLRAVVRARWSRWPARIRLAAVGLPLALVIGVPIGLAVSSSSPSYTLTAEFSETPGLYPGNAVDILGIPVGHVVSVTPSASGVAVKMRIASKYKVPATVGAFLMAPNVVNDRYVQLDPSYTSGPSLADGAVIPLARTEVPVSVDQIISTLDKLAKALGPEGANASGALSQLLHSAAHEFAGQGGALHTSISSFGAALQALSSNTSDVTSVIDNLGGLSHAAAQASISYQSFANELATVSATLNGDSASISLALNDLQQALGQVASFVQTNAGLGQNQQNLAQLLSVAPLALQNLSAAYDPANHALKARLDLNPGTGAFTQSVCGNSVLRLLLLAVPLDNPAGQPTTDPIPMTDLDCGVGYALSVLPVPPGASGPNMSLGALLAAGQ
jgi:phospholipid/cholesterol/gamma-HCH transport system substrate-binding protein